MTAKPADSPLVKRTMSVVARRKIAEFQRVRRMKIKAPTEEGYVVQRFTLCGQDVKCQTKYLRQPVSRRQATG